MRPSYAGTADTRGPTLCMAQMRYIASYRNAQFGFIARKPTAVIPSGVRGARNLSWVFVAPAKNQNLRGFFAGCATIAAVEELAPCVYMLASKSGVLYTGVTSNLSARVGQHKQGRIPGFTQKYKVNRLVWFEPHGTMISAIAREKEIKSWTRAKKVALVEAKNLEWRDLAER